MRSTGCYCWRSAGRGVRQSQAGLQPAARGDTRFLSETETRKAKAVLRVHDEPYMCLPLVFGTKAVQQRVHTSDLPLV